MLLVQCLQRGGKFFIVVGAAALSCLIGAAPAWAAAPIITNIADNPLTLVEDQSGSTTFDVSDSDLDPNLTVTASSNNQTLIPDANITITPNGGAGGQRQISISPAANQAGGPVTIDLVVSDGVEQSNASFVVNVTAVNDAPKISSVPASFDLDEDTPKNFTGQIGITDVDDSSGITISCAETGGSKLSSVSCTPASGGLGNRDIAITPVANASGSAAVKITVTDPGGKTDEATVTVNIAPINDAPVLTVPPDFTFNEDTVGTFNSNQVSIADVDDTTNLVIACSESSALISSVSCTPSSDGLGGRTVAITPVTNANGSASITIRVTDSGGLFDEEVVPVNITAVNDAPVLTVPPDFTFAEDTVGTFNAGQVSIADVDSSANLTITCSESSSLISSVSCTPSSGGLGARTVAITPAANANGSTTITIRVTDSGGAFDEAVVPVNITPVNDAPVLTVPASFTFNEDTVGTFNAGQVSIADVDNTTNLVIACSESSALISSVSCTPSSDGLGGRTVAITPAANANGSASITIRVTDSGGLFDEAVVPVNITPVVDVPIISIPNSVAIPEDGTTGPLPFTITDPDGGVIDSVTTISYDNLVPNPNVTVTHGSGVNYTIEASPRSNDAGRWATIRITARTVDNRTNYISFPVTVTKVPDAPIFLNFPLTQTVVKNHSTGPINVVGFDVDCYTAGDCGDASILTLVSANTALIPNDSAHISQRKTDTSLFFGNTTTSGLIGITTTRQIIITPTANLTGVAVINVTLNDGTGLQVSRPLTVMVISTNAPPQFVAEGNELVDTTMPEDSTRNLGFIVQDADNDPLQVSASTSNPTLLPPGALTVNGTGGNRTLTIVPAANLFGTATITVALSDGASTTLRTFLLTVTPVNDAPTVSEIADQILAFNKDTGALAFTVGDIETDAGNLQVTAASTNLSVIPLSKITLGGSGASRTVLVASGVTAGNSTITLNVSDGISTTAISFLVSVVGNNQPPTISAIADQTMEQNATLGPLSFTINDDLLPASSLTVGVTTDNPILFPTNRLTLNGNGSVRTITLKPADNLAGNARITLTVSDGFYVVPRSFLVTVSGGVGESPRVTQPKPASGSDNLKAGQPSATFTFTISDPDTSLTNLELTVISSDPSLVPVNNVEIECNRSSGVCTLTMTPLANRAGAAILTVVVSDGGNVASVQFTVKVWRDMFMPNSLQLYDPYDIDGNESNNTYARAFPIVVGPSYHGTVFSTSVSVMDTVDVLSLSLSKGHYRIQLDFSGADIDLYLRDNSANSFKTLAKSDLTSTNGPEVIDYVEALDGPVTRYIVVSLYQGSPGSKAYQIKVEKLP